MAGTDHWNSNLSTNIQYKKNNHSVFVIFQKLCQNINKKTIISGIFWTFKSKLLIIHAATYVALFLPDSSWLYNCFFICLVPYIPICFYNFLILCFYFHLLFHSRLATRHILQLRCLIWFHSQPANTGPEDVPLQRPQDVR